MPEFDLIIIGGGIIGGSTLYHLMTLGFRGRVLVVEREDALSKGSTALSAGGFRNIWTTPINMRLTGYSIGKLKNFREELGFTIGRIFGVDAGASKGAYVDPSEVKCD